MLTVQGGGREVSGVASWDQQKDYGDRLVMSLMVYVGMHWDEGLIAALALTEVEEMVHLVLCRRTRSERQVLKSLTFPFSLGLGTSN